eukprot:TRINITY_DN1400_c0_g1_i1.p1 TRINITY_DN1400_c0_g1~~TRINITY_DN1400_c0_g1_i1.p1  ORF type:complete len:103 (-),score=15.71 TRINITY_DN1400_c0_g1_i1:40-348(-)
MARFSVLLLSALTILACSVSAFNAHKYRHFLRSSGEPFTAMPKAVLVQLCVAVLCGVSTAVLAVKPLRSALQQHNALKTTFEQNYPRTGFQTFNHRGFNVKI